MDGKEFLAQAKKRNQQDRKQQKKLPKRTGRPAHAARRKASWLRGQARKNARRLAQAAAHKRNVARGYTAWDEAKARRFEKRHAVQ